MRRCRKRRRVHRKIAVAYVGVSVVAFAACALLGSVVTHGPPPALDAGLLGQRGIATGAARFFTSAGRFPVYAALCALCLIVASRRRAWLVAAAIGVVGLVADWRTSDLVKELVARARPPDPILAETSLAYPSGHAALSIYAYGLLAAIALRSPAPAAVRISVVILAGSWIAAIGWSRLALGAHYPSDVLGGYLFGSGWLAPAILATQSVLRTSPRDDEKPVNSV